MNKYIMTVVDQTNLIYMENIKNEKYLSLQSHYK